MSRRRKLEKFAQLLKYEHVYEMTEPGSALVKVSARDILNMRGQWARRPYEKKQKLCLELACGRGEYTLGLARLYPHKNFLGVDIKGARIYQGAKIALEEPLKNVAFLRIRIEQIANYFNPNEIDEMWITFPDPFPSKPNRRLTSKILLDNYLNILADEASIHLKTDDPDLYEYSIEIAKKHQEYHIVEQCDNISEIRLSRPDLNIQTYYETKHIANKKTIKYLHLKKND